MLAAFTNLFGSILLATLGTGAVADESRGTVAGAVVVAVTKTGGDADVAKRAKALLAELQIGTIDRSELSPALSTEYTATVLANAAKTLPKGEPRRFEQLAKTDIDGTTTYVFRVGWVEGDVDYVFGFDDGSYAVTKLFTRPGPPQ